MRKSVKSTARKSISFLLVAVLMMALLASTSAFAQEPASETKDWHFGLGIYGWFPDMSGQTVFTQTGGGGDFEIGIGDILDNLEFTLMGMFDVRKGRWGILTDGIYMDVGNSKTGVREATIGRNSLPVGATADVDFDLKSLVLALLGYYRAVDQTGATLDIVAGARYLDIEQKVNWVVSGNIGEIPVPDRTGAIEADLANWDAVIGVRGRFAFGSNNAWFIPYYLDVGAGDSDLTWEGIAGLGYAFSWGEIMAAWRYLYYDLPSDKAIEDMTFSGPLAGVVFRW